MRERTMGGGGGWGAAAGCRVRLQRACAGLHAVLLLCSVVPRAGPSRSPLEQEED